MVPKVLLMGGNVCTWDLWLGSVDFTVTGAGEVNFPEGLATGIAGPSVEFIDS